MAWPNFSISTNFTTFIETTLNTAINSCAKLFKDQSNGDFTGQVRLNSTMKRLESWDGSSWVAIDLSGTGIAAESITSGTVTANLAGTVNELTGTKQTVGFTIAGGTTSKTLTVSTDASISGTNSGDETATSIGTLINSATAITVPDDTDTIAMRNHTGGLLHKMTWAYVKSVLKTYFDTLYGARSQTCRAWCSFDGSIAGTNSPKSGFNVTSITKNSAGDYTVNFTSAFANANYVMVGSVVSNYASSSSMPIVKSATQLGLPVNKTTTACEIIIVYYSGLTENMTEIYLVFFGE